MWLLFSLWSINTLSWVLGLIQNNNNNLINVIDILSELFWKLIKYVNNIINPYNGDLRYENYIKLYNYVNKLYNLFYTWTSKIKDPSERYTPCIDLKILHFQLFQVEVYFFPFYLWIKIKNFYFLNQGVPYLNIILGGLGSQNILIYLNLLFLKLKLNNIMNILKLNKINKNIIFNEITNKFKLNKIMNRINLKKYICDYKKNINKESFSKLSNFLCLICLISLMY